VLEVSSIVVGELAANCCIIFSPGTSEAVVVDCGGDADRVAGTLADLDLTPVLLVSTHAHVDHIGGNEDLLVRYDGLELAGHPAEAEWYSRPSMNLSYFLGRSVQSPAPSRLLDEGDTVELGGEKLTVMHLPGHSPGSIGLAFDCSDGSVVVAGDTLFAGGIGRTDLHGGDSETLMQTIHKRLLSLPDDTIIFPGHGPQTTVGTEQETNPFVVGL